MNFQNKCLKKNKTFYRFPCDLGLSSSNQVILMSCRILNEPPEQWLVCSRTSFVSLWKLSVFLTDKDDSVPTGTRSSLAVQRTWQQWRHRNNLIPSPKEVLWETEKLRHHQTAKIITPNLILVAAADFTHYIYASGNIFSMPQLFCFRLELLDWIVSVIYKNT